MAGTGRVYRIGFMEFAATLWDWVVHLDQNLSLFVKQHGVWVYALLFVIVFCETGLVVTPFLPGDSLLFVAGTLAAAGGMDIATLMAVLVAAALCGDNCNYFIGRWVGVKFYGKFLNPDYLRRTHEFYARHGGKTIILARFLPIVRTYVPFVAGLGAMPYARYIAFCAAGAALWVGSLSLAGYFFGNIPAVQANLTVVIIGIVLLSVSPAVFVFLRQKLIQREG